MPVGRVTHIGRSGSSLFQVIDADPLFSPLQLEEVALLFKGPPLPPEPAVAETPPASAPGQPAAAPAPAVAKPGQAGPDRSPARSAKPGKPAPAAPAALRRARRADAGTRDPGRAAGPGRAASPGGQPDPGGPGRADPEKHRRSSRSEPR